MKLRAISVLLIGSSLSLLLGACAANPKTDRVYGESVRQMVRSQKVYVPPDDTPVEQGDGQRLDNVLDTYRGGSSPTQDDGNSGASILLDL